MPMAAIAPERKLIIDNIFFHSHNQSVGVEVNQMVNTECVGTRRATHYVLPHFFTGSTNNTTPLFLIQLGCLFKS